MLLDAGRESVPLAHRFVGATLAVARIRDAQALDGARRVGVGSGTGARPLRTRPVGLGRSVAFLSGATFVGATLAVARIRDTQALDESRRVALDGHSALALGPGRDKPVPYGRSR